MRSFDHALFGQAFPSRDPRQWFSYATVDKDTDDSPAVRFKGDDGSPLPYGPMVSVTLQPSGISLSARVASQVAGVGEADWYPFLAGDEVVIGIPEGDERAGAIILGRCNQEIDTFPMVVAGQDVTKNVFGFRRVRTPFVVETAASYLIRSAQTGSQIGIDSNGNVVINDGDKGSLLIGPEAISMSNGDQDVFVTILPPDAQVFIGAKSTTFLIDAAESKFITQGSVAFSTSGGSANMHGVTAEQVVALFINVLAQLASTSSFTSGPLAPAAYAAAPPTSCQTALASVLGPALQAMAASAPVGPAPGGEFLEFVAAVAPPLFGPAGALAAAMANPLAAVDPTGAIMGFGRSGFKL